MKPIFWVSLITAMGAAYFGLTLPSFELMILTCVLLLLSVVSAGIIAARELRVIR